MLIKSILSPIVLVALALPALATVTMDWVDVGNPGNAADPLTGYGAVGYAYQIGKYEVTNAQYGAFLNAKGQSNANDIYNSNMSSYGITQSGSSGSFSYSVTTALSNRPVVYVSWFDAARFANWMMNGQGSSDMETGAYTLGGVASGIIMANIGAKVYLPSESEWYKAAYYNAASTSFSLYPNGQNSISSDDANYDSSGSTDVGSYVSDSSFYGTFDQGGNVFEWNDTVNHGYARGLRGGAWYDSSGVMNSLGRTDGDVPTRESFNFGFRVASVPEPTSIILTMVAVGMMFLRRKR